MFFSRKKPARSYDPATQQPALRCSICTGEQVAGFISPDGFVTQKIQPVACLPGARCLDFLPLILP